MYVIAIFGLGMILISLIMIAWPERWRKLAVRFTRLPYMHPLEILLRLGFGICFIYYAASSAFPVTFRIVGYVLVAVGIGLLLTPPSSHRRLALWMIEKSANYFRPAGFASLLFGAFLLYAAYGR